MVGWYQITVKSYIKTISGYNAKDHDKLPEVSKPTSKTSAKKTEAKKPTSKKPVAKKNTVDKK